MKRTQKRFLALLGLALLVTSATFAQSDEDAVHAVIDDNIAAFVAGDVDALLATYTDDAVRMDSNAPIIEGAEANRADWEETFATQSFESEPTVHTVKVVGDWAWVRATFRDTSTNNESGESTASEGNWVLILQRQADDSWLIAREIWNLVHPPNTPGG